MSKKLLYLVLGLMAVMACEKDDFCTENPVTPKLILRFYDDANPQNVKAVQRFSIIGQGLTDSLFTNQNIDSISIPLNSAASSTTYIFKMNDGNGSTATNQVETLTISYDISDKFISRSCGFKANYENVVLTGSGNWIKNITPINTSSLDDQSQAHVQIFH